MPKLTYHLVGHLSQPVSTGEPLDVSENGDNRSNSQAGSLTRDLRALHDISMELARSSDVQSLCRRAVELGKLVLGFDRLGIWFIDTDDPDWNVGTWGTDEAGNLRDERESRVRRSPIIAPEEFYLGKIPILALKDEVCYDDRRNPVGRADKVLAPLWDGRQIIGELAVDNLLTRRPIDADRQEIIVVFARAIAHLSSLKRVEAELRQLASTDSLTGALNRRTATIILGKQVASAIRNSSPLAISVVDLDELKVANDQHGHAEGDAYIRAVFNSIVNRVRTSDTVGRIGGDEFLVIFPDCDSGLAERILDGVARVVTGSASDRLYRRSVSFGIASLAELDVLGDPASPDIDRCTSQLMDLADRRMYDAKRAKRLERG